MAEETSQDMSMDVNALYREDMVTDRKIGMIRRMIPIKSDGSDDSGRPTIYIGQAEIMTNMGPVPINFELEAKNLAEAVAAFSVGAQAAVERTVQQIQDLRRQQASQLVVPQGNIPGITGGAAPGRGGGKIQIP